MYAQFNQSIMMAYVTVHAHAHVYICLEAHTKFALPYIYSMIYTFRVSLASAAIITLCNAFETSHESPILDIKQNSPSQ